MARTPLARSSWDMVHQLFVSGDDPYAGADLPSSRNATAVLVALHGVLVLILLPLFPPDEALPDGLGWALALGGALLNLATAVWLLRARQVRFGVMLAIAYAGVAQLLVLQLLVPYKQDLARSSRAQPVPPLTHVW